MPPSANAHDKIFDTPHRAAFEIFGVKLHDARWGGFDCSKAEAEKGGASIFAIALFEHGVLWDELHKKFRYSVPRVWEGRVEANRAKLINLLYLAKRLPMRKVGFLKSEPLRQCAPEHLFTITDIDEETDPGAIWLTLDPEPSNDLSYPYRQATPRAFQLDYCELSRLRMKQEAETQRSLASAVEERRSRLAQAEKVPRKIVVQSVQYDRNPDVIAERLYLANGVCGGCGAKAPFIRRSNGDPYLEVHHVLPLSENGTDEVENTIALCPNCHREWHYGPPRA
ncbi:HNH endonuclease [Pseudacidovorax intermedius]|uniref:HNH endonuclease n=1 Tax=Pseudacidovorax intermedius TaxID=433924 RepID=UPI0009EAF973|nr:HNH endonuclease [Pseudacidovorax intermedius]